MVYRTRYMFKRTRTRYWVIDIWSFSHSGRRTDNGQRTRMWFYILSNAAMQCIGQKIMVFLKRITIMV